MASDFTLLQTPEYREELSRISAGADVVEQMLANGAYLALRRDPHQGRRIGSTDLWLIRQ